MTEKELESLFRYSLCCYFNQRHLIWKHHADEYSGSGQTDFYGHLLGKYVGFELKVSNNYFSDTQKQTIRQVTSTGGFACGILYLRTDDTYWLLPAPVVDTFSYKNRIGWLPIPVMNGQRLTLNLSVLPALLGVYT